MVYVHVPFCRSFCTYCGFYSELCKGWEGLPGAYVDALVREIALRGHDAAYSSDVDTLYMGGGTPSVLPLSAFERIKDAVVGAGLCSAEPSEFTVEVNPDDVLRQGTEFLRKLKALGVNRVSVGVQSFDDSVLRFMNRRHSAADARKAIAMLREAGFDNIGIDLIFGLGSFRPAKGAPLDFTTEMWRESIAEALSLKPEHISAYQLSIEPDSALEKLEDDGRYVSASDEACVAQYGILCSALAASGYRHYEISNFSLPGREAQHNSAYWRHIPYIGLGPAAHSFGRSADGKWFRRWNPDSIREYLAHFGPDAGSSASSDRLEFGGSEVLDNQQFREEEIMLGLRTSRGIKATLLEREVLVGELSSGNLVVCGNRVRIPESRFFVSDAIITELI